MELTYVEKAHNVLNEVNKAVLGKKTEVAEIMTAFLGLESRRVQFTPDVMPSDLTGFSVYRREEEKFVYQEGSIFCNILLADEINRTSPKTQSALLEVMEERKVSVDGVTRDAPSPFLVIATQNPSGTAGTQLLPEAQIDRFMITLTLGYPDYLSELEIARTAGSGSRNDNIQPVITKEDFLTMQQQIHETYIKDIVYDYIIKLISATRNHPYIERGASPRATIALVKTSKAYAWLQGRDYVVPADIIAQLPFVLFHRMTLNMSARMSGSKRQDILADILKRVPQPYLGAKQ